MADGFPPEFGYNAVVNEKIGAGVTVYGNGGMNTDYPGGQINCGRGPANVLCGSGNLGINMSQLIVAPTVAYKVNPDNAIGLSLLFVYQQFGATGLQAFSQASLAPNNLTHNNTDSSTGVGVRLGAMAVRGERSTLIVSLESLSRVTSNPFFAYMLERIDEGITGRPARPVNAVR